MAASKKTRVSTVSDADIRADIRAAQKAYDEAAEHFKPEAWPWVDAGYFTGIDRGSVKPVDVKRRNGWKAAYRHGELAIWREAILEKFQGRKIELRVDAYRELPFYGPGAVLLHGKLGLPGTKWQAAARDEERDNDFFRAIWLPDGTPENLILLNGTSPPIHAINAKRRLAADAEPAKFDLRGEGMAAEYLRFFCEHIQAEGGGFFISEYGYEKDWSPGPGKLPASDEAWDRYLRLGLSPNTHGRALQHVRDEQLDDLERKTGKRPPSASPFDRIGTKINLNGLYGIDPEGSGRAAMQPAGKDATIARFIATVFYFGLTFRAVFNVQMGGMVEMTDDQPVDLNSKVSGLLWDGSKSKNFIERTEKADDGEMPLGEGMSQ